MTKLEELVKKPIEIIIENNINEDMVIESDPVSVLKDKMLNRLGGQNNITEDFLFIIVNNLIDKEIKGVISWIDIDKIVDRVLVSKEEATLAELNIAMEFPARFIVKKTDQIQKALNIFNRESTNVVIVESETGSYLGKVKRSKLQNWFTIMTNS